MNRLSREERLKKWEEYKLQRMKMKVEKKEPEEKKEPDTVACDVCGKSVRKSYLSRHKKTKACVSSK